MLAVSVSAIAGGVLRREFLVLLQRKIPKKGLHQSIPSSRSALVQFASNKHIRRRGTNTEAVCVDPGRKAERNREKP